MMNRGSPCLLNFLLGTLPHMVSQNNCNGNINHNSNKNNNNSNNNENDSNNNNNNNDIITGLK